MSRVPWRVSEIEEVRRRYEAGEDDAVIARALGRTEASISSLRQAKHIHRPRASLKRGREWLPAELRKARSLYARGESRSKIAARLERSEIAIKRLVTTAGFRRSLGLPLGPEEYNSGSVQWKLTGSPLYAVSNQGEVMSLCPGSRGRILSQWRDPDGYYHVQFARGGKRQAVHKLALLAFHGPPPTPRHQAAHNDGDPGNNRESNLRWATPKENQADRIKHGTAQRKSTGQFVKCKIVHPPR